MSAFDRAAFNLTAYNAEETAGVQYLEITAESIIASAAEIAGASWMTISGSASISATLTMAACMMISGSSGSQIAAAAGSAAFVNVGIISEEQIRAETAAGANDFITAAIMAAVLPAADLAAVYWISLDLLEVVLDGCLINAEGEAAEEGTEV